MFFVGIFISTIAMSAGIGGATFFSPFFITILKLDLKSAITAGLFIEFFGFFSGVIGYYKRNLIDFNLVKQILPYSIIGTLFGFFLVGKIPDLIIKIILALILFFISLQFIFEKDKIKCHPKKTNKNKNLQNKKINFIDKYIHFFGGSLLGLSSTGLGELNEYNFLKRMKLKLSEAAGTSVFIITTSAVIGAFFHIITLENFDTFAKILSIVIFTIPGVIIGAQLGVYLSTKINKFFIEKFIAVLFLILIILLFI